jgi:hypothetical protein
VNCLRQDSSTDFLLAINQHARVGPSLQSLFRSRLGAMQFGLFTLLVHEMAHVMMPFIRAYCVRRDDFPQFEFLHTCRQELVPAQLWALLSGRGMQWAFRYPPRCLTAGGGWLESVEFGQLLEQLWRGAASMHDQRLFPQWQQEVNLPQPPVREDEPTPPAGIPALWPLRYQPRWSQTVVMPSQWIARFLPFIQSGGARGHIVREGCHQRNLLEDADAWQFPADVRNIVHHSYTIGRGSVSGERVIEMSRLWGSCRHVRVPQEDSPILRGEDEGEATAQTSPTPARPMRHSMMLKKLVMLEYN